MDSPSPHLPPTVGAGWLAEHLNDSDLVILDASWYLPAAGRDPVREYRLAHIPGAVRFDLDEASDPRTPLPHMLPSPARFAAILERLGVTRTDTVIVYDGSGEHLSSARVWWMFRVFGHPRVAVLDGGFTAWAQETRPISNLVPTRSARGYPEPPPPTRAVCDRAGIATIVANASPVQIVDARAASRFNGEVDEPRPGLRRGHIPGSINLPYTLCSDRKTGCLLPPAELLALFTDRGIDLRRPIVATCGSGVTACVIALAVEVIRAAGIAEVGPTVAVYDGSWAEWGRESRE